jgi:hypothetical protein
LYPISNKRGNFTRSEHVIFSGVRQTSVSAGGIVVAIDTRKRHCYRISVVPNSLNIKIALSLWHTASYYHFSKDNYFLTNVTEFNQYCSILLNEKRTTHNIHFFVIFYRLLSYNMIEYLEPDCFDLNRDIRLL